MNILDEKMARRAVVAKFLQPSEEVESDVGAIWRENPSVASRKDAEGFLVLTNERIIYGTFRLGVILDLPLTLLVIAEVPRSKLYRNMAHLVLKIDGKPQMRFWTGRKSAQEMVDAVQEAREDRNP